MELNEMTRRRNRGGLLTVWLLYIIAANVAGGLWLARIAPEKLPEWAAVFLWSNVVLNVLFAGALLLKQRWGFWGLWLVSLVMYFTSVIVGVRIPSLASQLIGNSILAAIMFKGQVRQYDLLSRKRSR